MTYSPKDRFKADDANLLLSRVTTGYDYVVEGGLSILKTAPALLQEIDATAIVDFPPYSVGVIKTTLDFDSGVKRVRVEADSYDHTAAPSSYLPYYVTNGSVQVSTGNKGWFKIIKPYELVYIRGDGVGMVGPDTNSVTVVENKFGLISFGTTDLDGDPACICTLDVSQVIKGVTTTSASNGSFATVAVHSLSRLGVSAANGCVIQVLNESGDVLDSGKQIQAKRIMQGNIWLLDYVLC